MNSKLMLLTTIVFGMIGQSVFAADPASTEIYCNIRSNGANLSCQMLGRDRKVMTPEDITYFIDSAEVAAFITLKSRKGMERTYKVDGKAPQFKRLADIKKSASISEISKAKSDLFAEIEKKVIKVSDEQDGQAAASELILADTSITYDKLMREQRALMAEVEGYRKNKDKVCTNTPAFESMSKVNSRLQQTLSNIVYAFQTPDSCMAGYKVFKEKDGSVDLRQLDSAGDYFKSNCRSSKQ